MNTSSAATAAASAADVLDPWSARLMSKVIPRLHR
jgi:hypothetical protein